MTTIVYSQGILATDSACSAGGTMIGTLRKMARNAQGYLVATAGATLSCAAVMRWVEHGMDEPGPSIDDDEFSALLIRPDGTVCLLGGDGIQVPIDAPYHVLGSGRDIALGALAMGASAENAVQIACRFDTASREPVQVMRLVEE